MQRILVVLRAPFDEQEVRARCARATESETSTHEVAICIVLPAGADGWRDGLFAQQTVTASLRASFGRRAESIAILTAADRPGERVEDCARSWGATSIDDAAVH